MHDAGRMCCGQAVGHACQELDNLSPRALRGLSPVPERAAVDELGDQILTAIELPDVVDRHDVRVVQRGCGLRFALKTAASSSVGQVVGQKLDGDRPIQLRVERAVDDAHAARAEGGLNLIRADSMADGYRRAGTAHEVCRHDHGRFPEKCLRRRAAARAATRHRAAMRHRPHRRLPETAPGRVRHARAPRDRDPRRAASARVSCVVLTVSPAAPSSSPAASLRSFANRVTPSRIDF